MRPDNVFEMALALAKADRSLDGMPFRRRDFGQWSYAANQVREAIARQTREIYDRQTAKHLEAKSGEKAHEAANREGRLPRNPLQRWVQTLTSTYAAEPKREFLFQGAEVDPESPQAKIAELLADRYNQASINDVLDETDTDLYLQWAKGLVPFFDAVNDELLIHEYTAPCIRVVENKNNPKRPWAVVIVGKDRELQADGSEMLVNVATIWEDFPETGTSRMTTVRGERVGETVERNAPAPFVHCFQRMPAVEDGYWGEAPGKSLAQICQMMSNDHWDSLGEVALMQGFAIANIYGLKQGQEVTISPKAALSWSGRSDMREGVEFANPAAPTMEIYELLDNVMADIREDFGIPDVQFDTASLQSGEAIIQANGPLAEVRKSRLKIFRRIETELCKRIIEELALNNAEGFAGAKSEDWSVRITFEEAQAAVSTQDAIAEEKHELEIGVINTVDAFMKRNPNVTREQAIEALRSREEEESELNPQPENTAGEEEVIVPDDAPDGDGLFDEADEPEEEDDA